MQRRHFELIAETVRTVIVGRDDVAKRFADRLSRENARFDRARFLSACGVSA